MAISRRFSAGTSIAGKSTELSRLSGFLVAIREVASIGNKEWIISLEGEGAPNPFPSIHEYFIHGCTYIDVRTGIKYTGSRDTNVVNWAALPTTLFGDYLFQGGADAAFQNGEHIIFN